MMIVTKKDVDRFWSNVDIRGESECWLWQLSRDKKNYGQFQLRGKCERSYRISWFLVNGLIPELFEGLPAMICHSCDNPPCCNPNHLFLGNHAINTKDSAVKDRRFSLRLGNRGKENCSAELVEVQVCEIKTLLREGVLTHREIAEIYGVSKSTITSIGSGKHWSHVN